jgi:hypothetical protein
VQCGQRDVRSTLRIRDKGKFFRYGIASAVLAGY